MRYAGSVDVDRLAAGHGRAHGDPLHVLEEVRDDRLAARMRGRARRRSPTRSPSSTPTTRAARPTSCRRPVSRRCATQSGSAADPGRAASAAATQRSTALAAVPGFTCAKPEATFYLFPNVTEAVRAHGLRRGRRVRHCRAAQHRCLVLHPAPLRQRPAGRDASTTSGSPTRASPPTTSPRASVASPIGSSAPMTRDRIVVARSDPRARPRRCCADAGEVWAWDHDEPIPTDDP